jgi:Sulfotransferase family
VIENQVPKASLLKEDVRPSDSKSAHWKVCLPRGRIWDIFERVVVIIGCQRSGTTLTGQIIGAHPRAFLVDETDGLHPWFQAQALGRIEESSLERTMLASASVKYRPANGRSEQRGQDGQPITLVLKAPNLTYDIELLARMRVPTSIVYPVRDPRAVVASMQRLSGIDFVGNQLRLINEHPLCSERFPAEFRIIQDAAKPIWLRQAAVWRIKTSMSQYCKDLGLPTTQFRYEDLIGNPDSVISRILTECQLADGPETRSAHLAYRGKGPGGTDRTRSIDAASLFEWRNSLTEAAQADILRVAGARAVEFGYA